jgi:flavin-dependent dehydrogenase
MEACDVLVVGGGPAGLVAARVLASLGRDVIVVERQVAPRAKPGEAIAPEARPVLAELGLLETLATRTDVARPCLGVRARWGDGGVAYRDFGFERFGLGWIVDRCAFEAILASLAAQAGASLRYGATATGVERVGRGIDLLLDGAGARRIRARMAVDATGRRALLARSSGAVRRRGGRLFAMALVSRGPGSAQPSWIDVRATPRGWWYGAEDPSGQRHRVFFGTAHEVRRLARRLARPSSPILHDAGSVLTSSIGGDRWICVGDAASAFDPLASQGLHHALASGIKGALACHHALDGQTEPIARYGRAVNEAFEVHLKMLRAQYGLEGRFSGSAFWRSRQTMQG